MGVLNCDRVGCDNIMCDRASTCGKYYICYECFDELVRLGPATDIDMFMDGCVKLGLNESASYAYFNEMFPERDCG